MNLTTLVFVIFFSISLAFTGEVLFTIIPAWRRMKIEQSSLDLTKCLSRINGDALLTAKISDGQYLHDVFYKSVLMTLCKKPRLKFKTLRLITYNEEDERARIKFRAEIDSLDKKTREIVNNAMYASGRIIFLCNPFLLILFSIKMIQAHNDFKTKSKKPKRFLQDRVIRSTEYYTIYAAEQRTHNDVECYAQ